MAVNALDFEQKGGYCKAEEVKVLVFIYKNL